MRVELRLELRNRANQIGVYSRLGQSQALGNFVNGGTAQVTSTSEVWGMSGTARYELTDDLTFKSITAYRSTKSRGIRDADNTPFTILTTDVGAEIEAHLDVRRAHAVFLCAHDVTHGVGQIGGRGATRLVLGAARDLLQIGDDLRHALRLALHDPERIAILG